MSSETKMQFTEVFETIRVCEERSVGRLQIYRPEAKNTINRMMIQECTHVLQKWSVDQSPIKVVVLEGLPEVFCLGADFNSTVTDIEAGTVPDQNPEELYKLWLHLAEGPFVSIAKVQGKVNAGGVGFVSACDVVISDENAVFSLSELLFSLMPACVLPFLIRRIGYQKAHYMTLMTRPFSANDAMESGLVDAVGDVELLLQVHMRRLNLLSKRGIERYKKYMSALSGGCGVFMNKAVAANRLVFSDPEVLRGIQDYVNSGKFPWEGQQ